MPSRRSRGLNITPARFNDWWRIILSDTANFQRVTGVDPSDGEAVEEIRQSIRRRIVGSGRIENILSGVDISEVNTGNASQVFKTQIREDIESITQGRPGSQIYIRFEVRGRRVGIKRELTKPEALNDILRGRTLSGLKTLAREIGRTWDQSVKNSFMGVLGASATSADAAAMMRALGLNSNRIKLEDYNITVTRASGYI